MGLFMMEAPRARALTSLVALLVASAISVRVPAATDLLGVYKAWTAQTYKEDEALVCMMWSQPEKAEGNYKRRGEIYVFVTHRPSARERNEIRFDSGYPFKPSSRVKVTIDKRVFSLLTEGSAAWPPSAAVEKSMLRAMRSGREMVVEGTSKRGTHTTDIYSLYGVSAAHKAITRACGR